MNNCFSVVAAALMLGLAGLAAPAGADPVDAPTSAPPTTAESLPDPSSDKKICKSLAYTGSRLPAKKLCKTKADWDAMTDQSQDVMRDRQRSARSTRPQD